MPAPKGNQFWKARASHGRPALYDDPQKLWEDCEEYFQWVADNPLIDAELLKNKLDSKLAAKPKMRAMTISGLCLFLQITTETWAQYRKKKDFSAVTTRAETVIYNQKFAGAAAEMLNPNIIARDLGLTDKQEMKASIVTVLEGDYDL